MALRSDVLRTRIDLDNKDANRAADEHARKVETTGKKVQGSNAKTAKSFKNIKAALGAVTVALAAVGAAIVVIDKLAARADKVSNLSRGFDTLGQRIGTTADVFLPKLRTATHGLVDDMELMKQANNAVILGVAKTDDEFAALTETALKLGRAVGLGPKEAIESLVTGIGRQSRMMLDNLGIIVKVEEANEKYAESIGVTVSALTDAQKKQAFFTATMEAAETASANLEVGVGTLSEAWMALKISITNATNALLGWINTAPSMVMDTADLFKLGESYGFVGDMLRFLRSEGEKGPIDIGAALDAQALEPFTAAVVRSKAALDAATSSHAAFRVSMADDAYLTAAVAKIAETNKALAETAALLDRLTTPVASTFSEPGGPSGEGPSTEALPLASLNLPDYGAAINLHQEYLTALNFMSAEQIAQLHDMQAQAAFDLIDLKIDAEQQGSDAQMALLLQRLDMETQAKIADWENRHALEIVSAQELEDAKNAIRQAGADKREQIAQAESARETQISNAAFNLMGALAQLAFKDSKKLAKAQTILYTARGIMSALSMHPPRPVLAALIAATGAVQLANINSTNYGGGGSASFSGGGATAAPTLAPGQGSGVIRREERPVEVHVFLEGQAVIQDPTEFARLIGEETQNQMNRGGVN